MKKLQGIVWFVILFFSFPFLTFALETETHKKINEYIATNSLNSFSLDNYLKNQLGFTNGIKEEFKSDKTKKAWEWIQFGGEYEDIPVFYLPYLRSLNHFHNPLTEEGFKGNCGGISSCVSASAWALMPLGTQSSITGNYSWHDVRDYYLKSLTSTDKTTRDTNFAEVFRGLGQLMHLIQDVSVPAHTRNDAHVIGYHYEKWVDNTRDKKPSLFQSLIATSVSFGNTIQNISNLFDTDQYNGTNPDVTNSNTIGLSEYTQANFLSEGLVGTTVGDFPYPKFDTTSITNRDYLRPDDTPYRRQYYLKNCCGETKGSQGYLLSAVDYLDYYRLQYPSLSFALPKIPVLDDNVYKDYASLLLPRAVGYSASLLNYFFRGKINMDKDPNNSSQYVIKNESDEYMSGNFTLYYDDVSGSRRYITSWNKAINAKSSSDSVSFTAPTDAKEKGKYILVFQGTMGNETGAVVGRVVEFKESGGRVLRYAEVYEGGAWHKKVSVVEVGRETPFFDLNTILQTGERLVYRNYGSYYLLPIMHFDRSDWNTFVALVVKSVRFEYPYGSGSLSKVYYVNHYRVVKFHITPDFTIQYDGNIYADTSAYYELRSWVYEPHAYCYTGEVKRENQEFWRYITINDMYLINGSLKLLYMVEEKTLDSDSDYAIPVDNEGRCSWTAGAGHSNYRFEVSQTLYFGGVIKTYSYTKIFNYEMFGIPYIGGRYEYSDSNGDFTSGEDMSNAAFWILNSNEVLYRPLSTYSNGVYTHKYIILPGDSVLKVVTSTSPSQDWRYVFPSDAGFTFSKYAYSLPFYNPTVGGYSELLGDKFVLLKGLTGFRLTGGNSPCLTKVTIDPALPKGYRLEDISPRIPAFNIVDYALSE